MNTFRRFAVLAAVLSVAACSSPVTLVNEAHTRPSFAQDQPTPEPEHSSTTTTTAAADSGANRGGGNLMGGN